MKFAWMVAAMLVAAAPASAHEVWVERDGAGPVRIYLGEPAEPMPPGGDPEFANLKAPRLLSAPRASLVRKAGFLEGAAPAGDVRVVDDNVFAPWGDAGKKEGVIYYARAGRAEANARLPFEIIPASAGGTRFILTRDGAPVAGVKVTIISPARVSSEMVTAADGGIAPALTESGRYLLSAAAKDVVRHRLPRGEVTTLHRVTTTTFSVP